MTTTYQEAIHEALGHDPADSLSPLRLKGEVEGLRIRADTLLEERDALRAALTSLADAAKWACRFGDTDSMRALRVQVEAARKLLNGGH